MEQPSPRTVVSSGFQRLVIISPLTEAASALYRLLQRRYPAGSTLLCADYDTRLRLEAEELVLLDSQGFDAAQLMLRLNRLQLDAPDCSVALFAFPVDYPLLDFLRFALVKGIYMAGVSEAKLLEGLDAMASGRVWFPRRAMDALAALRNPLPVTSAAAEQLTRREEQVLLLMAQGLRSPEIAEQLHLSPHTIKTHKNNLYRKLKVNSAEAAVLWLLGLNRGVV